MPRSPLRRRSKKRESAHREYLRWREGAMLRRPNCELRWSKDCWGRATDVHHVIKRSQGAPLIPKFEEDWMPVCRPCHNRVDQYPEEAKERGFVRRP